jgi:manganese/zinc/iron transport system permease protein
MLANSLSHTVLLGIILAYLLTLTSIQEGHFIDLKILIMGAFIAGLLTTVLTQVLTHFVKLQEDASVGLVFTTLFALAVVLVTLFTRSAHIGTEAIMGNVDALHIDDLGLVLFVALFNLIPIIFLFKEYQVTTFDPSFAKIVGISPGFFNYLLMVQVAATAIGAFRAVGVLLFLAFLVGPPLSARLWTHKLKTLIFLSMGIGIFCSLIGVALSRHILTTSRFPVSTAGLVVVCIALFYFISLLLKNIWKYRTKKVTILSNLI